MQAFASPVDSFNEQEKQMIQIAREKWLSEEQAITKLNEFKWVRPELFNKPTEQIKQPMSIDSFKMKSSESLAPTELMKDVPKFLINVPADSAEIRSQVGGLHGREPVHWHPH